MKAYKFSLSIKDFQIKERINIKKAEFQLIQK